MSDRYKKRLFLNADSSLSAFIIAVVPKKETSFKDGKITRPVVESNESLYPILTLADCSRKIDLDFSYYGQKEKSNSRKKLRLFRQTINEFADALEAEMDTDVKTNKTKSTNKTR